MITKYSCIKTYFNVKINYSKTTYHAACGRDGKLKGCDHVECELGKRPDIEMKIIAMTLHIIKKSLTVFLCCQIY